MAVKNQLAPTKPKLIDFLSDQATKSSISQVVGGNEVPRFITAMIAAVTAKPELSNCEYKTILSCGLVGESLKLSPSPTLGHYYMVPFEDKNNKRVVAQFILGYKGYIQLAIRSGYYKAINVIAIKEGELISFDPLNEVINVKLIEDDEDREAAPTAGYYAMFEYQNGFRKAMYWSKKKMEAHALKYSKGYASDKRNKTAYTFWTKDFDAMAYKTMLRQLISKWGIMSIDMQKAFENDAAEDYATDTGADYVTDPPVASPAPIAQAIEPDVLSPEDVKAISTEDSAVDSFFSA